MKITVILVLLLALSISADAQTAVEWDVSATASSLTEWTLDHIMADVLDIDTRILSTREDGCFIDAGSEDGVAVGQVFEIYRSPHSGGPEEILGQVQVAWTRTDYSFAGPRSGLDINKVTTLYFARLIHTPPSVALVSDISEGYIGDDLDRLLQAVYGFLSVRHNIKPILGPPDEPAWRLIIMPDFEGTIIRATLTDPGGEIYGTLTIDPSTGERPPEQLMLDQIYLADTTFPFQNSLAPPGRRSVKIACGNIVPSPADELAILDGRSLWVYDLTTSEPRLLTSLNISIPPGPVRHREDAGSLVLVDLDNDGQDEVCLAPPGGEHGEVWDFSSDKWEHLEFLENPPRAADSRTGGILTAPWKLTSASLDNGLLKWVYPFSDQETTALRSSNSITDIAVVPSDASSLPDLVLSDLSGRLYYQTGESDGHFLSGTWGCPVDVAMVGKNPAVLATSTGITSDTLTIFDLKMENPLAVFPIPKGPIVDITTGDIDRDRKAEIIIAVLEEDGIKIYY